jgi:hypothetical protein
MRRVYGRKVVRLTLGGLPFCPSRVYEAGYRRREALERCGRSQQRP